MAESSHNRLEGCRGFRRASELSRREALRIGGLFGCGLTLPQLFASRAHADKVGPISFGRAKQVIVLYLHGGHPQQETFDPKPNGPSAVRGEFGAIATSVPGIEFCELLPRTAQNAHRLAVIRSMSHSNPNHVTASLAANTGHAHPLGIPDIDIPPARTDFPPFGAVLNAIRPTPGDLPSWVRVGPLMRRNNGTVLHGQLPGFLGPAHDSFVVDQELLASDAKIEAVARAEGLTAMRLTARRDLLAQFDQARRIIDHSVQARDLNAYYQRAYSLLTSDRTRSAFDLAAEKQTTREKYGQHRVRSAVPVGPAAGGVRRTDD